MIDPFRASLKRFQPFIKQKFEHCKDFGLGGPGKTSLLFLECGYGDVMMDMLVPLLPDSITKIQGHDIVCDWCMRCASRYRSRSPRITFSKLNMNAHYDSRIERESFDHVILLFDTRWLSYADVYIANVTQLVSINGMGFFVIETKNTYLDCIIKLSEHERWSTLLSGIDRQMAPYRPGLSFPTPLLATLHVLCIKYEGRQIMKFVHTTSGIKERLEQDFKITTRITDEATRNAFYKEMIDGMKNNENVIEETVIFACLYFHRDRSLARL